MIRPSLLTAALALTLAALPVQAQDNEAGATIQARRALMAQLGFLQAKIEEHLAGPEMSYELYDLAQATAASLDAFALLFPPETNLQGGAEPIEGVDTTAAAHIWDDLPAFRQLVRDAASLSRQASEATTIEAFQADWDQVAQACSSCHESFVAFDPFAGL